MISTTLKDGTIKHTSPGWTGYQKPGEGYYKTKWYKDDTNYWRVEGSKTIYNITMDKLGRFTCECVGFKFRKNCKHIKKIKKKLDSHR